MNDDTATHEGVVDADATAADQVSSQATDQERPKSPRELAMEEIGAKRQAEFEQEAGISVDEQVDRQTEDVVEQETTPAQSTKRIKVDGEEREVTEEELIRNYQKNAAADKRLEDASRMAREARELLERASSQAARQTTTETTAEKTATTTNEGGTEDEAFDEFMTTLYEGDRESAKAAFKKLTGAGRQQATPSREELVEEVKQQLEVDNALTAFRRDFSDIVEDPYLAKIADDHLVSELNSGKHRTFGEAMSAAGNLTRDWMKSKGMVREAPAQERSTVDLTSRLERKAQVTDLPTASTRMPSTQVSAAESTPRQTIEEMRRARGQA